MPLSSLTKSLSVTVILCITLLASLPSNCQCGFGKKLLGVNIAEPDVSFLGIKLKKLDLVEPSVSPSLDQHQTIDDARIIRETVDKAVEKISHKLARNKKEILECGEGRIQDTLIIKKGELESLVDAMVTEKIAELGPLVDAKVTEIVGEVTALITAQIAAKRKEKQPLQEETTQSLQTKYLIGLLNDEQEKVKRYKERERKQHLQPGIILYMPTTTSSLDVNIYVKADGKTVGNVHSGADYTGPVYKDLFHALGFTEEEWKQQKKASLPNLPDRIFLRGSKLSKMETMTGEDVSKLQVDKKPPHEQDAWREIAVEWPVASGDVGKGDRGRQQNSNGTRSAGGHQPHINMPQYYSMTAFVKV